MTVLQDKKHVIKAGAADLEDVTWDPEDAMSTKEAKRVFDSVIAQGYMGYEPSGTGGEVVRDFNPQAEELVIRRQTAGG